MEISDEKMEVISNGIQDVKVDVSFRKISKSSICFHIWKIEEDHLEAEPNAQFGTFLNDAAYIVFAANQAGHHVNQDTITRESKSSSNLERFVHFWLGEKVSEPKRANVALKVQELDSFFNNVTVIFRETQNSESARFLSYFRKEIIIRPSTSSISTAYAKLYQLSGRKWLRCIETESVSWQYFCSDYLMVLKTEEQLFVWVGRSSSAIERQKSIDWATKQVSNSAQIILIDDGYEQLMPELQKTLWNSLLPLTEREVTQTTYLPEPQPQINKLKIYKCGYKGSRLHLDQLDVVIPTKDDLSDSTTVYVLDGFTQGIWLWVGNQATMQDNISAMGNGRAFVKKKKYNNSTPIVRVVEGHEPQEFLRLFPNWYSDWNESSVALKPVSTILGQFDSMTLSQRPKMAADTQLVDDGSGERQIYRVTASEVIELPVSKPVFFTTDNCYVVHYLVVTLSSNSGILENAGVSTIIYQWNGSEATSEAILKSEQYAKTTFESMREKVMFVQMCEFDETPHFLQIFDGKLIILQSTRSAHHSNNNDVNSNGNGVVEDVTPAYFSCEYFILRVYGDASYNSKAVEVYPLSSMSSKECYVIKATHIWVWCGQSSTGDAREVAKNIGALLGDSSLVLEGKEPKEFWRSMTQQMNRPLITNGSVCSNNSNGASATPCNYSPYNVNKTRPVAQLFLVWKHYEAYFSQEIIGYVQSDLYPECVYILDAGLVTYVWLGERAASHEREQYLKLAQYYLETVPIARRPTTAVAVVKQNDEPNVFKGFFENWSNELWKDYITYQEKRQLLSPNATVLTSKVKSDILNGEIGETSVPTVLLNYQKNFDRHHKYPIKILQQEINLLPSEVNPLRREMHLTHDDFVSLFHMSYWQFDDLPTWKKQELKKQHKLF